MHIFPLANLMLLCSVGAAQSDTKSPTGVVEVDLLFPRNETYAPTGNLPIVFSIQNAQVASLIASKISLDLWDLNNSSRSLSGAVFDIDLKSDFSSNNDSTYYAYYPVIQSGLEAESTYMLRWTFFWTNCTEETRTRRGPETIESNSTSWGVWFTTKTGAKSMDVGSISGSCPEKNQALAFNVAATHKVAPGVDWTGGETCGEVASSIPDPIPCRTLVSPSAATSISASIKSRLCSSNTGGSYVDCSPKEENSGALKVSISSKVGLMVGFVTASQLWF
ncbi:hypothetical protein E8E13_000254 [Curvularia kusanoi]|uniref:DUF7136 domain-containing protein n=1 Tax=Curvularia kusanoi TaxID=90978 RepID=A0A9P4T475_CURKU|nr:hypothetical protein E8E13_000254 [Curvularia kusanoi]